MARRIKGRWTGTYKLEAAKSHNEAYAKKQARALEEANEANSGSQPGNSCNMSKCGGYLVSNADDCNCTCHCGNPPCAVCTSGMHCSDCDWEVPDA